MLGCRFACAALIVALLVATATCQNESWAGRTETLALPGVTRNATFFLPAGLGAPPLPAWASFLLYAFLIVVLAMSCFLTRLAWQDVYNRLFPDYQRLCLNEPAESGLAEDIEQPLKKCAELLHHEALLVLAIPWAAVVLGLLATYMWGKVHSAMLVVVVPLLLRAAWVEKKVLEVLATEDCQGVLEKLASEVQPQELSQEDPPCAKKLRTWCPNTLERCRWCYAFLKSKMELTDALTDGLTVASAFTLSAAAKQRWLNAVTSARGPLRTPAARLGPGGALAIALALATGAQYGALRVLQEHTLKHPEEKEYSPLMAAYCPAELAGLGAVATDLKLTTRTGGALEPEMFALAGIRTARTLAENMPQLYLQTSLLAAEGEGLIQQPLVLISVLSGLASCFGGTMELAKVTKNLIAGGNLKGEDWHFVLFFMIGVLANVLILAVAAVKLFGVEACRSRIWTLEAGCVP